MNKNQELKEKASEINQELNESELDTVAGGTSIIDTIKGIWDKWT